MFAWGMVGLLAGLFAKQLRTSRVTLCIFGALSGIVYSALMDIWTVLWAEGSFVLSRYLAAIVSSAGYAALYSASNVAFLLLLAKPIGSKLQRIREKYGA